MHHLTTTTTWKFRSACLYGWSNTSHKQEGNAYPVLKPDFYVFLLIFQHKWMFLSTMQTLPFEGHNVAYQCKGLNQSNSVCEYKVNLSTNEKVITENKTLTQIVNNVE